MILKKKKATKRKKKGVSLTKLTYQIHEPCHEI
jgi:hypothetical protein